MKRSEAGATSVFDKLVARPCDSTTQSRVIGLGTVRPAGLLAHMERYFFDYRTNGSLAVDEEGHDFLDLDAAHNEAFAALAESIRDNVRSAAGSDQHLVVEVRDARGPVLEVSALFRSKILRRN